jgi:predicted ATPase
LAQEVDDALGQLADFLDIDGAHLRFRQAVTRDAAYEGLPYRRRAALHGRLAVQLDQQDGDSVSGATVRSLHHFRAGNYAAALE